MSREPVVLAIDTSSDVVVGVARGDDVLAEHRNDDPRRHVEDLMPTVIDTLAAAGVGRRALTAVVVGMGPGPFTGLRVGIATARVLADTLGVPLYPVSALDAIAAEWASRPERPPTGEFLVVADARRREVYWARFGADGVRIEGPTVDAPDALPDLPVAGPGAALCPERDLGVGAPRRLSGGWLARVGPVLPTAGDEPLYLRRPDAVVPTGRKSVLARRVGGR